MKRNVIISGDFTISELTAPKPSNASKPKTAADRIAALKAAGIDTSCFFPMGSDMVVKVVDGVPVQVLDDDPIYQSIASGATSTSTRSSVVSSWRRCSACFVS